MISCTTHAERRAEYRCSGCRAFLCADCIEEGHRLLFCRLCREQAVPLFEDAPATTPALERSRRLGRRYRLVDALVYPFRGVGRYTLPALALFLGSGLLLAGLADLILHALLLLILPGLLFEVVRTTADGDDQLPDWPDASDPFARFTEIGRGAAVLALTAAPAWLAARATGCDLEPYLQTHSEGFCLLTSFSAQAIGLVLGVFAFGAAAVHDTTWLALRADLHLEALFGPAGRDALTTSILVAALLAGARLAQLGLAHVPVLGALVSALVSIYALFLGAHLVGRLFLLHAKVLHPLYRE